MNIKKCKCIKRKRPGNASGPDRFIGRGHLLTSKKIASSGCIIVTVKPTNFSAV
jgi:hypothetical protein